MRSNFDAMGPLQLARLIREHGGVHPSKKKVYYALLWKAFRQYSFSKSAVKTDMSSSPPPLFILGHFRSGTTLLHKIMASSKLAAAPDTFDYLFPHIPLRLKSPTKRLLQKWMDRKGVKHPNYNDYSVNLSDPIEDDVWIASAARASTFYLSFVFREDPQNWWNRTVFFKNEKDRNHWEASYQSFLEFLMARNPGKRLVLKNPPHTGRIPSLLRCCPEANFIFISREPQAVFRSTLRMLEGYIDGYYFLGNRQRKDWESIILDFYILLHQAYLRDRSTIPNAQLVEIDYTDLVREPMEVVRSIYERLMPHQWLEDEEQIRLAVRKEKNYRQRSSAQPPHPLVQKQWKPIYDQLRSGFPESDAIQ